MNADDDCDYDTCLLKKARAEIVGLEKQLEEMTVQAAFWKHAAEDALSGWLQQEDISIALRAKLVRACNEGLCLLKLARLLDTFPITFDYLEALKAEALADDAPEDQ